MFWVRVLTDKIDIVIIGGGPAGISAALMARNRGKTAVIVSLDPSGSGLYKAELISNYPGLPDITGAELHERMRNHAQSVGIEFIRGRVIGVSKHSGGFFTAVGSDVYDSAAIILATGVTQKSSFPGELELLGMGVSYCAVCDGMLYRGKRVAVISLSPDGEHESEFLRNIGCEVEHFTRDSGKFAINGTDRVSSLTVGSNEYPVDGVFIFRNSVALNYIMPNLNIVDNHIETDRSMKTSVDGVFAAGDCTGKPYQIAKAVGEGSVAALSAADFIDKNK